MKRAGRLATQVGPVVAENARDAMRLVDALLTRQAAPVFIDIPDTRTNLQAHLHRHGFTPQRRFVRMARGIAIAPAAGLFAIAGPELG